jgi:hypothetical protein
MAVCLCIRGVSHLGRAFGAISAASTLHRCAGRGDLFLAAYRNLTAHEQFEWSPAWCTLRRSDLAGGGRVESASRRITAKRCFLALRRAKAKFTQDTGCHPQDPMVASFCRRSHFDLRKEKLHVSILLCLKIGRSPRRAQVCSIVECLGDYNRPLTRQARTNSVLTSYRRLDATGLS